jgi:CheY-like chemotaxis protein
VLKWSQPVPSVLVVDDDPDASFLLARILEGSGLYRAKTANSVKQGLALARSGRVDLVLTDIGLPDAPGWKLIDALRGSADTSRVPVVVVSGEDDATRRRKCREAGAVAFMRKPIRSRSLLRLVERTLGQHADRTSAAAPTTPSPSKRAASTPMAAVVKIDEEIADLIPDYLERCRARVSDLRGLEGAGQLERAQRVGHDLKGTGRAYGFAQLSALAADLEESAKVGQVRAIEECIDLLQAYLEQVSYSTQDEGPGVSD